MKWPRLLLKNIVSALKYLYLGRVNRSGDAPTSLARAEGLMGEIDCSRESAQRVAKKMTWYGCAGIKVFDVNPYLFSSQHSSH